MGILRRLEPTQVESRQGLSDDLARRWQAVVFLDSRYSRNEGFRKVESERGGWFLSGGCHRGILSGASDRRNLD